MSELSTTPNNANRPKTTRQVAVIDIGSASIRMAIGQISDNGEVSTLDSLSQAVDLGRDAFTRGFISRQTIEDSVRVLKSYRKIMRAYGIEAAENVRVIATSAVREATNRLAFIDRIYIATGFEIEPLDEADISRVTFLGMRDYLEVNKANTNLPTLIMEVGGGTTELLVTQGRNVQFSRVFRLGSLRLRKTLEAYRAPSGKLRSIMETQIMRTIREIREHIPPSDEQMELVAMGGDMRFAADKLEPSWKKEHHAHIPLKKLERLADKLLCMTEDQIVKEYGIAFSEAETVAPAILTNVLLAKELQLDQVSVTGVTLREGLLKEMAVSNFWTANFGEQVIRSALDLGKHYDFDAPHARHVEKLACLLFHQLKEEHRLDARYEVILRVGALLHEIGLFVGTRSHHKHAMYLIRNSELFGLSRKDHLLAGLVARYHRRASPQSTHEGYNTLDRHERVAVAQMAAILRVAIALDDSRSQRIHDLQCFEEEGWLIISIPLVEDLSLEQLALKQHGTLFEETFGKPVLLRMQ
jgi:exopolyphosphatase / guanosine-5'-triphosphate,3'-diphosphate pyrophosphatase